MANSIVALVGMPAAGKSTVAGILKAKFGYDWIRTRDIVESFSGSGAIDRLQTTGASLSEGAGAEAFCKALFARIDPNRPSVIDAVRPIEHWRRLRVEFGKRIILAAIVAPRDLRQQRMLDSGRGESLQMRDDHRVEADIPALIDESPFILVNCEHIDFRVRQLVNFVDHQTSNEAMLSN